MATALELQVRLAEARDARHRLIIGEQAVTVREADGSTVIYAQPNASALDSYISALEGQAAAAQGVAGVARAPIYIKF